MPIAERGRKGKPSLYREADVREWLAARETNGRAPGALMDLAQERARQARAQAQLAEQRFAVNRRELVPRAEVLRAFGQERDAVRAKLLAVPLAYAERATRAATLEGVAGVERVFREAIYDALRELTGGKTQTESAA